MATPTAFPKVPLKAWTVLRARASTAPSTKFTPGTVAALLDMSSPKSAADNIVYPLRRLGLLTEEGALSERGNKWRNDATYAEACQEILDEVYPADLAALTTSDGSPDKAKITTWLEHQGFGGSNARQMAATYALIASRTPPDPAAASEGKREPSKRAASKSAPGKKVSDDAKVDESGKRDAVEVNQNGTKPVIHLDIQIHIPAAASTEQIDQIFASMAKHLYGR